MKILSVVGTRPEAIKMAPVIKALAAHSAFDTKVCVTGQHREMLDTVFDFFEISPDFDLNIMQKGQSTTDATCAILQQIQPIYAAWSPDIILVHGDTSTTFAAALAAHYQRISVGHIEAGLRTGNKYSPWPEEMNRVLTGRLADIHFVPTIQAQKHLQAEGVASNSIHFIGNSVIDALQYTLTRLKADTALQLRMKEQFSFLKSEKKTILVTGHRRENFGDGLSQICDALFQLAQRDDVQLVYPMHLNPAVRECVQRKLSHLAHCFLLEPLEYPSFVYLMSQSYLILTDSGGIQEEAPAIGIPVLIMRDTTERPEAVTVGNNKIVGAQTQSIVDSACELLDKPHIYEQMAQPNFMYGDGTAANKIVHILEQYGASHA